MKLDTALYARLLREAADNPRLRQATDLRTSSADQSQRMLNALLPGTAVPVHRRDRRGAQRLPANKFFIVRVWA